MTMGLVLIAAAAATGAFADLEAIDRQVAGFTGAPIGAVGGALTPVDRRLRLRSCHGGLVLSWRTTLRDSVVVQCGDANGWRIFVPVRQAAPVAAAQEPDAIRRGDAISIAITGEGFSMSQPGEALDSGAVGDWISVRPASATRNRADPMRARIVRPGLVAVPLP
jgi:flagella basal body P-ring formation protein FlgA